MEFQKGEWSEDHQKNNRSTHTAKKILPAAEAAKKGIYDINMFKYLKMYLLNNKYFV